MSDSLVIEVVRKVVTVDCAVEEAFRVFTADALAWWPVETHSIHETVREIVFEPEAGGEVYEVSTGGEKGHWATVTAWEPPGRLVLAWNIRQARAGPDRGRDPLRRRRRGDARRARAPRLGGARRGRRGEAGELRHGLGRRARDSTTTGSRHRRRPAPWAARAGGARGRGAGGGAARTPSSPLPARPAPPADRRSCPRAQLAPRRGAARLERGRAHEVVALGLPVPAAPAAWAHGASASTRAARARSPRAPPPPRAPAEARARPTRPARCRLRASPRQGDRRSRSGRGGSGRRRRGRRARAAGRRRSALTGGHEPAQLLGTIEPLVPGDGRVRRRRRREHEERGVAEPPLLEPELGALAERRRCTRPSRRSAITRGAKIRASSSSRSAAPAKSAARRSLEPRVVLRAAFVSPIPSASSPAAPAARRATA